MARVGQSRTVLIPVGGASVFGPNLQLWIIPCHVSPLKGLHHELAAFYVLLMALNELK
jgi:hypothetical protein